MNRAQRRAVSGTIAEFKEFFVQAESLGTLHKSLHGQALPGLDYEQGDQVLYHPRNIIDAKSKHWHSFRSPSVLNEEEVLDTFHSIHQVAMEEDLPIISVSDVRHAVRQMKAKAGLEVDMMTPTDFETLPDSAMAELAVLFEACEHYGA
eukprot:9473137-Pyramimonas_sp.AAC.1